MGARIRAHEWVTTPLGPSQTWPPSLRTAVRILLTTGHPMFIFWGERAVCIYNDAYKASLGPEKHPAILGMPGNEAWPEIWQIIGPQIAQVMRGDGPTWHENQLVPILRDGRIAEVYWTYSYGPIDEPGAPHGVGGVLVVCTETTQQVLAAQRAVAESARLAAMFEQAPGFVAMLSGPEHRFTYANVAYRRLVDGREIVGRTVAEALPEAAEQGYVALLDQVWRSGEAYHAESARFVAEGRERFVDFIYQPIAGAMGATQGILVQGTDVTDRARAEAMRRRLLERQEALLGLTRAVMEEDQDEASLARTVLEAVAPLVQADFCVNYRLDADGEGLTLVAAPGAPPTFADAGARLRLGQAFCGTVAATRERVNADAARIASDPLGAFVRGVGGRAYSCHPLLDSDGQVLGTFSFGARGRDGFGKEEADFLQTVCHLVSLAWQRRRGEVAAREEEQRLRHVLDELDNVYAVAPVGLCVLDTELRYVRVNERLAEINGASAADHIGRTVREVVPGIAAQAEAALRHILDAGEPLLGIEIVGETPARPGDTRVWEENWLPLRDRAGRIVGVNITAEDVTERRRSAEALAASEAALRRLNETLEARVRAEVAAREEAQARLAQARRMEALGQLAGGIAHDFNNVLQVVQGGARLIELRPEDVERTRRLMGMMAEAAARGSSVTRRLLAFSRRADLRAEPLDAKDLLGGIAEVLSHTMGDGIRTEVAAAADLPPLVADKGQIETVLVNLASNARDAMDGQGVITLLAMAETIAPGGPRSSIRLEPGEYVRLSVRDTGTGMLPEVLARVTEPFFTTKPSGKGTGLGLAMARGFAEQSGGGLHVESVPCAGTTVSLWLPAAAAAAARSDATLRVQPEPSGHLADGQRVRVLVVDDDLTVREIVAEGLRGAGFDVTALASAADVLDRLDAGEAVHALVSDLSMPGMDGLALIKATHRRRPGLPTILLTGFATDAAELAMRGAVSGAFSLLRKPIEIAALAERIAALVGGAEEG